MGFKTKVRKLTDTCRQRMKLDRPTVASHGSAYKKVYAQLQAAAKSIVRIHLLRHSVSLAQPLTLPGLMGTSVLPEEGNVCPSSVVTNADRASANASEVTPRQVGGKLPETGRSPAAL